MIVIHWLALTNMVYFAQQIVCQMICEFTLTSVYKIMILFDYRYRGLLRGLYNQ